jgi:cyclase
MLRHRVVTVLTLNDGVLFRTKQFQPDYRYTINFVDTWSVDEVVVLDITRPGHGTRGNFYEAVEKLATNCFVPLAAGGGVRTIADVRTMLGVGGDKVVLNTGALERPGLVSEAAALYGSQCVVVSIDAAHHADGRYEVYAAAGTEPTGLDPAEWARRAQDLGAGEILVTSIERDGSLEGYDNELNCRVSESVTVPVLVCGGAGKWQDFEDGFVRGHASAVCTTNIYHFTETSIRSAKRYLSGVGIPVRM